MMTVLVELWFIKIQSIQYDLTTYTSSASWAGGTDLTDNDVTSLI